MCRIAKSIFIVLVTTGVFHSTSFGSQEEHAQSKAAEEDPIPKEAWFVSALPSSIRLNPISGKVIEDRPDIYKMRPLGQLLERNWAFDGKKVRIHAARGEYVSFQIVLGRTTD